MEREYKNDDKPNVMHATQLRTRKRSTMTGRRIMERVGRMIMLNMSQRALRGALFPTRLIS